jgi:DNA-binding MarR family transcriptional regulator
MTIVATPKGESGDGSEGEPLGPVLQRAHKAARQLLRRLLEPLGLTPVQAEALRRLLAQNGLSLNELAERMRTDAPTLCGVVDCLVTAGYAERREDPQDRRRLRLFATDKAWQIQEALREVEERRQALLTSGLSPTEVEQLKALLLRVEKAALGS